MKTEIKVIIWDVDGTLYKSQPKTTAKFESIRRRLLEKVWRQDYQPELKALLNNYKQKYKSTTKALAITAGLSLEEITRHVEGHFKNRPLNTDPTLIKMFQKLTPFYHLAFRNGSQAETKKIITLLGLNKIKYPYPTELGPFYKVWGTIDNFQTLKPDPFVFDYLKLWIFRNFFWNQKEKVTIDSINRTAGRVLMVGDRPEVDLKPAKTAGFKTALVWNQNKTSLDYVDWSVADVYHLADYLI